MEKELLEKINRVYAQIKQLREKGAKMKNIGENLGLTPSVFSALYSTIIPSVINLIEKGDDLDGAVSTSISMVNNVSKKKFFELINLIDSKLPEIDHNSISHISDERLFFGDIQRAASKAMSQADHYAGIYLAYSRSSHKDALKVEPYLVKKLMKGELMPRVCLKNETNHEFWGVGLFTTHQMGHIFINEQRNKRLALRNISLQLPLFESPKTLKGIYISTDFNHNPIARRIIFIKQTDSDSVEEFANYASKIILPGEFPTQKEEEYYNYTCQSSDYVRSFMYYSLDEDNNDLKMEKMILDLK